MAPPARPPRFAGGVFLALGAIGGALIGLTLGQPTAGLLAGFALGFLAAVLFWLVQRPR